MIPTLFRRYSERKSGTVRKIISLSYVKWVLILYAGFTWQLLQLVNCETDWRRPSYPPYNESNNQQRSLLYHPYQQPYSLPYNQPYNNQAPRRSPSVYGGEYKNLVDNSLDDEGPLLVAHSYDNYGRSVKSTEFLERYTHRRTGKPYLRETRGKRGVLHLYNMISCATDCDPISYKGYGCFCGFLGSGSALDGIDRCCQKHDECYEDLFCPFFTVYFQPYYWRCRRGRPVCAVENLDTSNEFITACAADLCECDRKLAMCLRRQECPNRPALCTSSPLRFLQNLIMIR